MTVRAVAAHPRRRRLLAVVLALIMLGDTVLPGLVLAGGPQQPEFGSFAATGADDMVDLFTGDFQYSIPLMQVGHHPISLSYHSGITMDQEASWVGLGWTLNAGAITRNVRGIPDDLCGDKITYTQNMRKNRTLGVSTSFGVQEIFGFEPLTLGVSMGASVNNYIGTSFEKGVNISLRSAQGAKTPMNGSLGLNSSSEDGLTIQPSVGLDIMHSKNDNSGRQYMGSLSIGAGFNSRQGLKQLSFGYDVIQDQGGPAATINLGTPTYIPRVGLPMRNSSYTGSFRVGFGVNGVYPYAGIAGYSMTQKIMATTQVRPAYGYMHAAEGSANVNAVLDFNRERDGTFTDALPYLPLVGHTQDVFTVQGPGIGGSFRAYRSSFGNVFDPRTGSSSDGGNLSFETGNGHTGADIVANSVITSSGKWTASNLALPHLGYASSQSDPLAEPVFFKDAGEPTIDPEPEIFTAYGGGRPVRAELWEAAPFLTLADQNITGPGTNVTLPSGSPRSKRIPRGQNISMLTKRDMRAHFGVEEPVAGTYQAVLPDNPDDSRHIGEMTTVGKDGMRYVYGLPAYNMKQVEVTFAVPGKELEDINGKTLYTIDDNSINNTNGRDHYFSSTEMPPSAHSYLLTCILSPDYIDSDDVPGPSDGDLGDYTKFEYEKRSEVFGWRTPAEAWVANHDPGLLADPDDDKGSFVYGEKEIWYLWKITTRDQVAEFKREARTDVVGMGINGAAVPSENLERLKEIKLYAKDDFGLPGAIPIKVAHFRYTYELCQDVPTAHPTLGTGKLTLASVWFTYGSSNRGNTSPYVFHYDEEGTSDCWFNPAYDFRSMDRWGNFKPTPGAACFTAIHAGVTIGPLQNQRNQFFPYTEQNKIVADRAAQAWNLQRIELPTGGLIEVDYEADDYAFVQNHQVMAMRNLVAIQYRDQPFPDACAECPFKDPAVLLFEKPITRVYFQKDDASVPAEDYVDVGSLIYMKVAVNDFRSSESDIVTGPDLFANKTDLVPVYVRVTSVGEGATGIGWLGIESVSIADSGPLNYSPMHLAALQHARLNYSPFIYHKYPVGDDEPLSRDLLLGFWQSIVEPGPILNILTGNVNPNNEVINMDIAAEWDLSSSWVRLKKPDHIKFGGGSRVMAVKITDQWEQMNSATLPSVTYGQTYSYTTQLTESEPTLISSGVAAYEPILGNDENPMRVPVVYDDEKPAAPDDKFYQEQPFGELFFPAPVVGYGEVTVKDILHEDIGRHGTGTTKNLFYTAKDFPVILDQTDMTKDRDVTSFDLMSIFRVDVKDYMTAAQGFSIELNDMHGKPKATRIYQQGEGGALGAMVSSEEYFYRRAPYGTGSFRLKNEAVTIAADGTRDEAQIGMEYELVADLRESTTNVLGAGIRFNTDMVFLGAMTPVPMLLPSLNKERTRFRSIVMTKVINRYGLLEKVVSYDQGATVSDENLAYDAETGSVLLTRTVNAYDRPIYSMRFPAYWYHQDMAPASRNIGAHFSALSFISGVTSLVDAERYFTPGDEVLVRDGSGDEARMWALEVEPDALTLIDKAGARIPNGTYAIRVLRSGHRNMTDQTMATLTSLSDPVVGWGSNVYTDIIEAQAIEYAQGWRTPCECLEDGEDVLTTNPYVLGTRGSWRPKRTFSYLTDRIRTDYNKNTDIRTDGRFAAFSPFYKLGSGDWEKDPMGWTFTEEITEFGAFGQSLETRNALDIHSSGMFGHRGKLQLATGVNARYQEIGFASFEDYVPADCHDLHFRFPEPVDLEQRGHTGRWSIRVGEDPVIMTQPLVLCENVECSLALELTEDEGEVQVRIIGGSAPFTIDHTVVNGEGLFAPDPSDPNAFLLSGTGTISVTVSDVNDCQVIRFIDVE